MLQRSGVAPVHSGLQTPPTQSGVAPEHSLPHAPQWLSSVWVSTHVLSQFSCGDVHDTVIWHVPLVPFGVQVSFAPHVVPHAPQFASSVVGSTHVLLQLISGVLHATVG
jgi:hypothetical protein